MEPILPQSEVNTPSSNTVSPPLPSAKPFIHKLLIVIIVLVAVFSMGLYLLSQKKPPSEQVTTSDSKSPTIAITPVAATIKPVDDPLHRIVFLKNPNRENNMQIQAWIMKPDGSNPEQLTIANVTAAYKPPASNLVFYATNKEHSSFFIKNLTTNSVKEIIPIKYPDPKVETGIGFPGLAAISPDGMYLIFSTFFTQPCPTLAPGEPVPYEGGPCQPDLNTGIESGFYLYDVANDTSTHLGGEMRVSSWDMTRQKLYLINDTFKASGLEQFDLRTKQFQRIDNATMFGYGGFSLVNSNKIARLQGTTGNNPNEESYSGFTIFDRNENKEITVDSGRWADVQPFAAVSADEQYILYERSTHREKGMVTEEIYRYSVKDGEKVLLTPQTPTESYGLRGVWVDDHTYVTLVDTVEQEQYYNGNNFLISIDVPQKTITRITPDNDVYGFAM